MGGKLAKAEYLFTSGLAGLISGLLAKGPVLAGSLGLVLTGCLPAIGLICGLMFTLQKFSR